MQKQLGRCKNEGTINDLKNKRNEEAPISKAKDVKDLGVLIQAII